MMEFNRFLRHAFAPVVIWATAKGWLPEGAQGDVIEAAIMIVGFVIPYVWSMKRDPNRK